MYHIMEQLRKCQGSKKSSMSMPLCVKVLEEHNERLLRLEALAGFKAVEEIVKEVEKELIEEPKKSVKEPVEEVEELPEIIIPEPQEVFIPKSEVIHRLPEEIIEEENLLDSLLNTLSRIQDEASLVEEELKSIKELENQPEEEIEDDNMSINTECTDACREILENADESLIQHIDCKNCLKQKAKAYKKEKKRQEKERAKQAKAIKQKQKDLLLLEQKQIAMKLQHIRSGLNEVEIINNAKTRINEDYNTLAQNYYDEH